MAPSGHAARYRPHQQLGQDVDDNRDQEQGQADFNQRAEVEVAGGFAEFVGDNARHGVSGGEEGFGDFGAVADDHGDGHGFTEGATESEDDAAENSDAGVGQDSGANHLPAGGAEGEGGFPLLLRNGSHDLAGNGGDDRHDHDGEDNAGGEHADAVGRAVE